MQTYFRYLEIIDSQDGKALCDYMTESMKPMPYRAEIEESRVSKEMLFGEGPFSCLYTGDWRYTLYILKRKLQYDMGFMRGFADHAGRERDADRMQLCQYSRRHRYSNFAYYFCFSFNRKVYCRLNC